MRRAVFEEVSGDRMERGRERLIDRLAQRAGLRRWQRLAKAASGMTADNLHRYRAQAWALRHHLDRVIHVADGALSLPLTGANSMKRPCGTDWVWRPDMWRLSIPLPGIAAAPERALICDGTTLFHDCKRSELTVRQVRNTRATDRAPFGMRLDVLAFDGSFLSLVLDLPEEAVAGLRETHLIRLDAVVETERPIGLFARLNVKHGPNTEQIVREFPPGETEVTVEFDLAYTKMNEKRVERLWVDLIFGQPAMNEITLRDVTLSRRPRAAL